MTEDEAVAILNCIDTPRPGDPYRDSETFHFEADEVLLAMVPESVRAAWHALGDRVNGFWYA